MLIAICAGVVLFCGLILAGAIIVDAAIWVFKERKD